MTTWAMGNGARGVKSFVKIGPAEGESISYAKISLPACRRKCLLAGSPLLLMAVKSSSSWAPLTFDLTQPQVAKIESARRTLSLPTASEVVRLAIAQFDYASYEARRPPHR